MQDVYNSAMLDKFNRYQSDENTGIELLYRSGDLNNVEFIETDDIKLYNSKCAEFDILPVPILNDLDFDRINTYLIPEHFKTLDVEQYVRDRLVDNVLTTDKVDRVEEELALFKARNLYHVLRVLIYIIETMRKHNLVWGVGRGSSVSSYVLYLIGVHKVDSLKYNLDIKEFLK